MTLTRVLLKLLVLALFPAMLVIVGCGELAASLEEDTAQLRDMMDVVKEQLDVQAEAIDELGEITVSSQNLTDELEERATEDPSIADLYLVSADISDGLGRVMSQVSRITDISATVGQARRLSENANRNAQRLVDRTQMFDIFAEAAGIDMPAGTRGSSDDDGGGTNPLALGGMLFSGIAATAGIGYLRRRGGAGVIGRSVMSILSGGNGANNRSAPPRTQTLQQPMQPQLPAPIIVQVPVPTPAYPPTQESVIPPAASSPPAQQAPPVPPAQQATPPDAQPV